MAEEERSYAILRFDGLLLHTRPITWEEAWWLYQYAYNIVEDRGLRARYLEEWGNVMDVGENVTHLERQLEKWRCDPRYIITRIYGDPDELAEKVSWLLMHEDLPPEVRQALRGPLSRVGEFLQRPVEPKPVVAPVRYFESPNLHVVPGPAGVVRAWPERLLYGSQSLGLYGISVFEGSFWLWKRGIFTPFHVIIVGRDAADREIIDTVLRDEAVRGFLERYGNGFRELLREREAELVDMGYDDVVRKAKVILTTLDLLTAGRREEEEGVPA